MIEDGKQVDLRFELKLDDGSVVASNLAEGEVLSYTHGNSELLPALEAELEGLGQGDAKEVRLEAADGYGERQEELKQDVPVDQIPQEAREVGAVLTAQDSEGGQRQVRITEVSEDAVTLDLNHPLAGEALNFNVTVESVS